MSDKEEKLAKLIEKTKDTIGEKEVVEAVKQCGVNAAQQKEALKDNDNKLDKLGVDMKMKPRNLFKIFDKVADKEKLQRTLASRGMWTQLQAIQGGTKPFISGIRAWAQFAISVFGYALSCVLPPLTAAHMVAFVSCFMNPGTAQNYVTHVRNGC